MPATGIARAQRPQERHSLRLPLGWVPGAEQRPVWRALTACGPCLFFRPAERRGSSVSRAAPRLRAASHPTRTSPEIRKGTFQ